MIRIDLIYDRHNFLHDPPPKAISPNHIPYYDLTLLFKGRLHYTLDGRDISLCDGDAVLMPPGTRRQREAPGESAEYISFNFTCDSPISLPLHLRSAVHSDVLLLISAYDKIKASAYSSHKEKTEHLLACLLLLLKERVERQHVSPLTLKIMEYLHLHLAEKITLDDIGRLTFFSPIYCDTVFKREIGQSIIDYLLDRRIDEAKKLILEGSCSLQQIAELVGFRDYNYFSRVFKARSGYSPTAYRRSTYTALP